MSELTSERRREILQSLGSTKCEGCGGSKRARMSHCGRCYSKLPPKLKNALYRRFGDGYEEAFEKSLIYLRAA